MVSQVRNKKSQSLFTYQQSLGLLVTLAFALLACTTQKTKSASGQQSPALQDAKKLDSESVIKSLQLVTSEGQNSQGSFSPSGQQIVFVSAERNDHDNSQVHMFDFVSRKVSRVTFSDGKVLRPFYSPSGFRLYYSSSTDEEKEHPDLARLTGTAGGVSTDFELNLLLAKVFPGFEIYSRELVDDEISRFRRSAGFDVAEDIDANGKRLLVTSQKSDKTEISLIDAINGSAISSQVSVPFAYRASPRFVNSNDKSKKNTNSFIWIQKNKDATQKIVLTKIGSKDSNTLVDKPGNYDTLAVSPLGDRFAFAADFAESGNMDIYWSKIDSVCIERITFAKGHDLFPSFSPDGQKLIITSERTGNHQLYILDLNILDNPTCL